ncbi:TPA: YbjQ family protein [Candidatus Woesearchaeota archaeon]|nr:YbjQ family protein [Candidatus Woesearchaeota archaeon]HIH05607.1 YbjQ family protein [Candidatus Woesearchaeota archaeon]HIH92340.1 YbjQ family protein [Candidatus Woesearchaeota archaeon]HII64321.1 YbjQ family protein [Candidatus Woesearchaeota archaeon]HII65879.1 YbjQ family protein [Candidatus Woesearchaeota archaeon]
MITTTTETIPNRKIKEVVGIARGSTIRAKHIGKDIFATLKQFIGGELKGYTEMMNEAREEALQRMVAHAESMKADAVVNVRFMSAEVMPGAAEMMAYGTAVKLGK